MESITFDHLGTSGWPLQSIPSSCTEPGGFTHFAYMFSFFLFFLWVQCWGSPGSCTTALGGRSDRPGKRWAAIALHGDRMEGSHITARVRPLARSSVRGPNGEAHISNHWESKASAAFWMPQDWCVLKPHMYIILFFLLEYLTSRGFDHFGAHSLLLYSKWIAVSIFIWNRQSVETVWTLSEAEEKH